MLTIRGVELNFNITSPADLTRFNEAQKVAAERDAAVKSPVDPSDPNFIASYIEWLNALLSIYGNFLDDAFGDGVAERLMTNNPSLDELFELNDEVAEVLGDFYAADGEYMQALTARFSGTKYKPNRAARRHPDKQ